MASDPIHISKMMVSEDMLPPSCLSSPRTLYRPSNHCPIESEHRALHALLQQEKELLAAITIQRNARQSEATALARRVRTLSSTLFANQKMLENSTAFASALHTFRSGTTRRVATQRDDLRELAAWLPHTPTFLSKWEQMIKDAEGLDETLREEVHQLEMRVEETRIQLRAAETVQHYSGQSLELFNDLIAKLEESIRKKSSGPLSAVNRVPTEIWESIFDLAVEMEAADIQKGPLIQHEPFTAALKLSGVSQSWRGIATGRPALWRRTCAPWLVG